MTNEKGDATLDSRGVQFHRDAWGRLLLKQSGKSESIPVEPVRAFPLTHPEEHISLLDDDGREVLRIASLQELPAEQRAILEREFVEREFSPVIQRVVQIRPGGPPCVWEVETDRGQTKFQLESEDDVRRLPDGSLILIDTNGIRYRIPGIERLDAGSRTVLRRLL